VKLPRSRRNVILAEAEAGLTAASGPAVRLSLAGQARSSLNVLSALRHAGTFVGGAFALVGLFLLAVMLPAPRGDSRAGANPCVSGELAYTFQPQVLRRIFHSSARGVLVHGRCVSIACCIWPHARRSSSQRSAADPSISGV
jgi:hypothetical protein